MCSKRNHPTRTYLLRCWQEKAAPGEKVRWRFSLEEVLRKRPRQGFDSLDALVAFLQAELVSNENGPLTAGEDGREMD